jgi:peptide/nickel transport system substrate-binding protein
LRIEMSATISSIDPADWPADAAQAAAKAELSGLVFETLVRLDRTGQARPWLAASWSHDAARKRWIFTPRPGVTLQNGTKWDPGPIAIPDDRPIDRILADLARPQNAIVVRLPDGTLTGTGPFSLTAWAGDKATFTAYAGYWGGRPYLDSIQIRMGRTQREQALDFELGNADAVEVPVAELRRLQRNSKLAVSVPVEVMALVFDGPRAVAPALEQAVALSIDRVAIHTVMLQRQGEVSAALLPQWLSGYSFVFPVARDLARARQLAAGARPLTLGYDPSDALAHSIAERIALNAGEAGISLRTMPDVVSPDAHLLRLHIISFDAPTDLEDLAAQLKVPAPAPGPLYSQESALLAGNRVIPLFHLPFVWRLGPKVRDWTAPATGGSPETGPAAWRLDDVWLDNGARP